MTALRGYALWVLINTRELLRQCLIGMGTREKDDNVAHSFLSFRTE